MLTMAGCSMAQKICFIMQNSCACKECSKWKELFGAEENYKGFARDQTWLAGIKPFVGGLMPKTTRKRIFCLQERGFKYSVKDSSQNVTTVIQVRFIFFDPTKED